MCLRYHILGRWKSGRGRATNVFYASAKVDGMPIAEMSVRLSSLMPSTISLPSTRISRILAKCAKGLERCLSGWRHELVLLESQFNPVLLLHDWLIMYPVFPVRIY